MIIGIVSATREILIVGARLSLARDKAPSALRNALLELGVNAGVVLGLAYAQRLVAAGISTELHLHPQVPQAFEALVPMAAISQRSAADRHRVLASL